MTHEAFSSVPLGLRLHAEVQLRLEGCLPELGCALLAISAGYIVLKMIVRVQRRLTFKSIEVFHYG